MADENLVSQITVTGGNEAAAEVENFAGKSAAAFDKLDASVNRSSKDIASASDKIAQSSNKAAAGIQNVGQAAAGGRMQAFTNELKNVESAISEVSKKLPQLAQSVGRFATRIAAAGAAAAAAGLGIAKAAANVANTVNGTSTALEDNVKAQTNANNAMLAGEVAAINYQSSQRKLFKEFQLGKISYSQYRDQVKALNDDYTEQQRVAAEVANATERVALENEKLQKQLKDRQAFQALIDTFGGPLTSSLLQFGNTVNQVKNSFLQNLGPAAANLVDLIGGVVTRNSGAINQFFTDASQKINQLITQNGPQIEQFITNVGKATASVFNGLIAAAPGVIDFFNNSLVPAISKVASFLDGVATAINKVFGTQLTGGSIVIIAILAQVTGSIRLLTTLLRILGGIGKSFFKIFEGGALALNAAFGGKGAGQVIKLTGAVSRGGNVFKAFFAILRTGLPLIVTIGEVIATAFGISLGPALAIVIALGAALFFLVTKVDWKAFAASAVNAVQAIITFFGQLIQGAKNIGNSIVQFFVDAWNLVKSAASATAQFVVDAWNAVVGFFSAIGSGISGALSTAWELIKSAASAAADFIRNAWNGLTAFFSTLGTAIGDLLSAGWERVKQLASTAAQFVTDAWKVVQDFFTNLPSTLQSVWDNIKQAIISAFDSAVSTVKGIFAGLLASAKAFLQPIIDLLKSIIGLSGSADTGQGAQGFARGGQARTGSVRGPGSSTSDSILARLSNGEFIMRARAVAKYGLGVMHALNTGQFRLPEFAFGGFVAPAPARASFATGGSVTGGSSLQPLNLSIDGHTFDGLLMPEEVGAKLTKFAVSRQNRSAGRKPAWVGNRRN